MFKKIFQYRQFISSCVKREFQSRYQRSLFGAAWAVVNPLAMIIVYTVIFSQVMKAKLPGIDSTFGYSIFLCAGILTWGLFAEIVGRCTTVFLDNANIIKKLNFPRICLPVTVVCTAIINFLIISCLFLLFLMISGNFPGFLILSVVPLLIILILFSMGLGITLGVLNVFFRDVGQLLGIVMQFWFWMTPIVYPISIIPQWAVGFLKWNPIMQIIGGFQTVFVEQKWPNMEGPAIVGLISGGLCMIALRLYRNHVGEMVDEL